MITMNLRILAGLLKLNGKNAFPFFVDLTFYSRIILFFSSSIVCYIVFQGKMLK